MMDIESLSCKIECQDTLSRFCAALDGEGGAEAFLADDVVIVGPEGEAVGADAHHLIKARNSEIVTRHIVTNLLITPTGSCTADGKAYCLLYTTPRDEAGSIVATMPECPSAAGNFELQFRKTTSGWKISCYHSIAVIVAGKSVQA
jgi:hypothetical protein